MNKIKVTTTAYDAGAAICQFYERPNPKLNQPPIRGTKAQYWFQYFSTVNKVSNT
jgi:hypothetical protein